MRSSYVAGGATVRQAAAWRYVRHARATVMQFADPDLVDLPIPGNDDGIRAVEVIVRQLADAIAQTKATTAAQSKDDEPKAAFIHIQRSISVIIGV